MEDLISRQAAIELFNDNTLSLEDGAYVQERLKQLPSVQPKTDNILFYIDHISNSGMGKKKALEFLRKYVEKSAE